MILKGYGEMMNKLEWSRFSMRLCSYATVEGAGSETEQL